MKTYILHTKSFNISIYLFQFDLATITDITNGYDCFSRVADQIFPTLFPVLNGRSLNK